MFFSARDENKICRLGAMQPGRRRRKTEKEPENTVSINNYVIKMHIQNY